MDITIKVNDDQFNELMKDGIKALTTDDLKQVLITGITQMFESTTGQQLLTNILFEENRYWTYSSEKYRLSDFGERVLKSCISEKEFTDLKELLINKINTYGKEILSEALVKIIMKGFANDIDVKDAITRSADECAREMFIQHEQKYHNN